MPTSGTKGGSGYCDINTDPPCLEIDLMEANRKAIQTTLHTQVLTFITHSLSLPLSHLLPSLLTPHPRPFDQAGTGHASDGTCNQNGCAINWGLNNQSHYGSGSASAVDSSRPYEVDATFSMEGDMTVKIKQDGKSHTFWTSLTAGNSKDGPVGVPRSYFYHIGRAMENVSRAPLPMPSSCAVHVSLLADRFSVLCPADCRPPAPSCPADCWSPAS